jgi:hypothetical protein
MVFVCARSCLHAHPHACISRIYTRDISRCHRLSHRTPTPPHTVVSTPATHVYAHAALLDLLILLVLPLLYMQKLYQAGSREHSRLPFLAGSTYSNYMRLTDSRDLCATFPPTFVKNVGEGGAVAALKLCTVVGVHSSCCQRAQGIRNLPMSGFIAGLDGRKQTQKPWAPQPGDTPKCLKAQAQAPWCLCNLESNCSRG